MGKKGFFDLEDFFFYLLYILFITLVLIVLGFGGCLNTSSTEVSFAEKTFLAADAKQELGGYMRVVLPSYAELEEREVRNRQEMLLPWLRPDGGGVTPWSVNSAQDDVKAYLEGTEQGYTGKPLIEFVAFLKHESETKNMDFYPGMSMADAALDFASIALLSRPICEEDSGEFSYVCFYHLFTYPAVKVEFEQGDVADMKKDDFSKEDLHNMRTFMFGERAKAWQVIPLPGGMVAVVKMEVGDG